MTVAHTIGFSRIGVQRELKVAVENYWQKKIDQASLKEEGKRLRATHWAWQKDAGLDFISVGDFSWYDQVLDMSALLGVVPERFGKNITDVDLDTYFRMARGRAPSGSDTTACEMTKWFDTNYHYIVPEFQTQQTFTISSTKIFDEVAEAKSLGYNNVKPVLLGPLSYLWLGKVKDAASFDKLSLIDSLLAAYRQILTRLQSTGVTWVQIDEPILVLDLPKAWQEAFQHVYRQLHIEQLNLLLTTYFGGLGDNTALAAGLPTAGLHIDVVRDPTQLAKVVKYLTPKKILSVGIVDGRNIWRTNLRAALQTLQSVEQTFGDHLWVSSSCSLLHSPVDLDQETKLDNELKNWLAFGKQKLREIALLSTALKNGESAIAADLVASDAAHQSRKSSARIHQPAVKQRCQAITSAMAKRQNPYAIRQKVQKTELKLPLFPTTTIGSFPQTQEIRGLRRDLKAGVINEATYEAKIKDHIAYAIQKQEELEIDVFVHGEAERNDMVEYFGELLEGFAFTQNGWVQSYGSRCVKPPIIFGDVYRPKAMTIDWTQYAQSRTQKWMKGMLTGPITILCWSFVRDDQSRFETAKQIALALRDEVVDLANAGIHVIQIDEPAFREGLPLRKPDWQAYLKQAVEAFRLASCGVPDQIQIHTHMCYSEFNDIIEAIADLDADVITIETSRSDMELLQAFERFKYPNEIGPGVYDIHSPRLPSVDEIVNLIRKASQYVPVERLWINPDCGLKTRTWPEAEEALKNMVTAAKQLRKEFQDKRVTNKEQAV